MALKPRPSPSFAGDRAEEEAADYVADRALELARIARAHGLDLLAQFLDIAIREANLRGSDPGGAEEAC